MLIFFVYRITKQTPVISLHHFGSAYVKAYGGPLLPRQPRGKYFYIFFTGSRIFKEELLFI